MNRCPLTRSQSALKRNRSQGGQWFRSEKPKRCALFFLYCSLRWARWDSAVCMCVLYICVCVCVCVSVPATTKDRIVCDLYTLSFDERYYTNSRLRQRQRLQLRLLWLWLRCSSTAWLAFLLFFCAYARHAELAHSHQTKRQTTTTATTTATFGGGNEAIAMKWKCIRVCLSRRYTSASAPASVSAPAPTTASTASSASSPNLSRSVKVSASAVMDHIRMRLQIRRAR